MASLGWSTVSISINYPYTIGTSGIVGSTDSPTKIYLDRVVNLLSTNIGQRPLNPTYGVDWSSALFENDDVLEPAVTQAIQLAIATWMPEVSLSDISFIKNDFEGIETVILSLKLPDNTIANLQVNSSVLNYDGTIAG